MFVFEYWHLFMVGVTLNSVRTYLFVYNISKNLIRFKCLQTVVKFNVLNGVVDSTLVGVLA